MCHEEHKKGDYHGKVLYLEENRKVGVNYGQGKQIRIGTGKG